MTNLDTHPEQSGEQRPSRRDLLKFFGKGAAALGVASLGLGASEAQADLGWKANKAPFIQATADARKDRADAERGEIEGLNNLIKNTQDKVFAKKGVRPSREQTIAFLRKHSKTKHLPWDLLD